LAEPWMPESRVGVGIIGVSPVRGQPTDTIRFLALDAT
jgi:hypothetical protein